LKDQVIGHLTSRDPASFWTSGQWMTERTGGSDVSGTQTIARRTGDGVFRLYGTKWFSSATTSQMAMALARVEGDPPGNRGLSLFFIKLRRADGSLDNIVIHRLKDKLGTRALPTAELTLEGTEAVLIGEQGKGVRSIASLFNVTRLYNAVCAVSSMRRGYALARDYAERRYAFGKKLIDHPLHARTLDEIEWEVWGHLFLTFHVMGLQGKDELGEASQDEKLLLRILTPIAKLYTGKRSVVLVSEALECFGGAGYIEDAGIAKLLRDTQVLSIWEGTTNILSLDVLRAMQREGAGAPLEADIRRRLALITHPKLAPARERLARTYRESSEVLTKALQTSDEEVERSGRRIAFGLARTYIGTLMLEYCQVQPSGKAESVASFWIS
jgi:alkylation response protein AidB-like acyl-CoA dehydrogenase